MSDPRSPTRQSPEHGNDFTANWPWLNVLMRERGAHSFHVARQDGKFASGKDKYVVTLFEEHGHIISSHDAFPYFTGNDVKYRCKRTPRTATLAFRPDASAPPPTQPTQPSTQTALSQGMSSLALATTQASPIRHLTIHAQEAEAKASQPGPPTTVFFEGMDGSLWETTDHAWAAHINSLSEQGRMDFFHSGAILGGRKATRVPDIQPCRRQQPQERQPAPRLELRSRQPTAQDLDEWGTYEREQMALAGASSASEAASDEEPRQYEPPSINAGRYRRRAQRRRERAAQLQIERKAFFAALGANRPYDEDR